ncbi:MAG: right-handed parallel beta-helix repeat-containing protein [Candidatus Odinarchaeia archaeon]
MKRLFCLLILLLAVPAYGTDYYVDVANGSDSNTGLSEEQAFASLAKAADMVEDGNTVYVQATGVYSAQDGANDCVLYVDDAGTGIAPITWIGYVSDVNDGGIVTIDASTNSLTNCMKLPGTGYWNVFKNFRFTGASGTGVEGTNADYLIFVNCSFDNNGNHGIQLDDYNTFFNCTFYGNEGRGAYGVGGIRYLNCISHNNDGYGLSLHEGVVFNCLLYGNGNHNIYFQDGSALGSYVFNTTIDANGHNGIYQGATDSGYNMVVQNTILANGYRGIQSLSSHGDLVVDSHNLFYNNSRENVENWPDPEDSFAAYRGSLVTTTDPFTNAAAHDYSLASDSAGIEAGADVALTKSIWDDFNEGAGNNPPSGSSDIDIGAIQEPAGAGGGGAGGGKVIGKSVVQ